MAYFSNGTEGMDYCAQWCDRCVHQNGADGKSGCPVWLVHLLYAYEECNSKSNAKAMLDTLIPMVPSKHGNYRVAGQCSMGQVGNSCGGQNLLQRKEGDAACQSVPVTECLEYQLALDTPTSRSSTVSNAAPSVRSALVAAADGSTVGRGTERHLASLSNPNSRSAL